MSPALVSLLLAAISAPPTLPVGGLAEYEGNMLAVKGSAVASEKRFKFRLLASGEEGAMRLHWIVAESGRGGFHWTERFGRTDLNAEGASAGDRPALLYRRDDGDSPVALFIPWVTAPANLKVGTNWKTSDLEHHVMASTKTQGRDCWVIESKNAYGRKRSFAVDKVSRQVIELNESVTIGQGEQFRLRFRLSEQRQLETKKLAVAVQIADALIDLRHRLGRVKRNDLAVLKQRHLTILRDELPDLVKRAAATPFFTILNEAKQDLKKQDLRTGTVAAMKKQAIGRDLTRLKLNNLRGVSTPAVESGCVTVIHFWQYRDKPLKQPYGQSAYLDFLYRNRKDDGVRVVGVNVDVRLADAATKSAAVRSAKKFRSFMNLSYPLLLDAGRELKKIGDPRQAGGKLPLFVVLGKNGKVIEYKVGFYDVDPRRGLYELDDLITRELDKSE